MSSPSGSSASTSSEQYFDRSSPQSTTASLSTQSTAPLSPCSPSILLNPLPPSRKRGGGKTVLVSVTPSAPPAHFLKENPSYAYPSSPPNAGLELKSRSSSVDAKRGSGQGVEAPPSGATCVVDAEGKCIKFAELPPGRRMYRSNSLSIGVAARAKMINSQGGGPPVGQPRYAGPQQWYQTGGVVPPDVYTYKDVQKGLTKIWSRVRRRSSSTASSTDSVEAQAMERDGKGKSSEIEHIEEASDEDECSDDEDVNGSDGDDDEERGRSVGLDLRGMDDRAESVSSTTSEPHTPEDSVMIEKFTPSHKGKERATTMAVAI